MKMKIKSLYCEQCKSMKKFENYYTYSFISILLKAICIIFFSFIPVFGTIIGLALFISAFFPTKSSGFTCAECGWKYKK